MAIAAASGACFGLLHALLTVPMAQSQHVTGLGITLLATSLASYIYRLAVPAKSTPPTIAPFTPVDLPFLNVPFLQATAPTYLALGLVVVVAYVLWRTPLGLAIRMVGEHPQGAQAQGIGVFSLRTGCVVVGSAIIERIAANLDEANGARPGLVAAVHGLVAELAAGVRGARRA
jgi:simple sugar transport system permease protein